MKGDLNSHIHSDSRVEGNSIFKVLADTIPHLVWITDADGRTLYFNQRWIDYTGFTIDDPYAWNVLLHPDDAERVQKAWENCVSSGASFEVEYRLLSRTGEYRWFSVQGIPSKNSDQKIEKWFGTCTDIQERKRIESEYKTLAEHYKVLFDSPLPKWIVDVESLKFIDVNDAAVKHYGYTREEFLSMTGADLRHPDDREAYRFAMAQDFEAAKPFLHRIHRQIRKNGTVIYAQATTREIFVDGRRARMAAIVDVSHQVESDRRQKEIFEALQLAKTEAEHARSEAERANHLKSAFLANMSHEIRTPMTAVLGFTEVLRDFDLAPEERKNIFSRIDASGKALLQLIEDILDISKIEAGKMELERIPFSPELVIREVIDLLRLSAEQKGIKLRFEKLESTPTLATSDVIRVRQILLNLVGNAIKFTREGEVVVRSSCPDQGTLIFEVCDTGIGISTQDRQKLFQPFVQADESITRSFGGTGLGLFLSRKLCQELGGNLYLAESALGFGSRFVAMISAEPVEYSPPRI